MKVLCVLLASLLSASCAVYKIVPENIPTQFSSDSVLEVTRPEFTYPEGFQCFEPMMYVVTIGIIPTHCIETYHVSEVSESGHTTEPSLSTVKVTLMSGWVALLLAPLPEWRYGYGQDIESEILEVVNSAGK